MSKDQKKAYTQKSKFRGRRQLLERQLNGQSKLQTPAAFSKPFRFNRELRLHGEVFARYSRNYVLSYFLSRGALEDFFFFFRTRPKFDQYFFVRSSKLQRLNYFSRSYRASSVIGFSAAQGAFNRFFYSRFRRLFKRRAYSRIYRRLFSARLSKRFSAFNSAFRSAKVVIFLKQTKNNVFFSVQAPNGRVLFTYTNGQTIYKGPRRSTPVACETAGKRVSFLLSQVRIKKVSVVFGSSVNSFTRAAIKGLSTYLVYSGLVHSLSRAHNGIKQRSTRRVLSLLQLLK